MSNRAFSFDFIPGLALYWLWRMRKQERYPITTMTMRALCLMRVLIHMLTSSLNLRIKIKIEWVAYCRSLLSNNGDVLVQRDASAH